MSDLTLGGGERQVLLARIEELEQEQTGLRQTIQALDADHAQLLAIIKSMTEAVYIGGPDEIWTCNQPALDMLGFDSPEDLKDNIGALAERIQTRDAQTGERIIPEDEPFARALRGEKVVREVLLTQVKTGQEITVRCAAAPIICDDQIIGAVAINTDITDQKAAAIEREQLYAEAQTAIDMRDHLIGIAAHDLKNPITTLLGNAQLLQRRLNRRELLDERDTKAFKALISQARRLHRMVLSLLNVDRIQYQELAFTAYPIDLTSLVVNLVTEIQPTLTKHTVHINDASGPLLIEGDLVQLEQVVYNLLYNAVKYSPEGGIIEVDISQHNDHAYMHMRDNGIGIPEEALPHLFERFYRAPNAKAQRINGLGLGLNLVQDIVQRHQGSIAVESQEGQGSTFTLKFPLVQS